MQTAMTMNTLGLGLGARPAMRSRVVGTKSAKAIVGTPVVGKPVQLATRRAAVTVKAGGNPEPIVQAPFKGIQEDLAARGPLYIDDFKQGVSPKSLVSDQCFFAGPPPTTETSFPARSVPRAPVAAVRDAKRPNSRETAAPEPFRPIPARIVPDARVPPRALPPELDRPAPRHSDSTSKIGLHWELFFQLRLARHASSMIHDPEPDRSMTPSTIANRRLPSSSSSSRPSRPPSPSVPCSPPPPPACSARPR